VSRILNTQEVALPDEFIGHERVCDHCGTKFLCDSGDVAYKHEATHSRSNEQEQFRSVSVPCPTCSSVLVLRTSIGAGYQPAPGGSPVDPRTMTMPSVSAETPRRLSDRTTCVVRSVASDSERYVIRQGS